MDKHLSLLDCAFASGAPQERRGPSAAFWRHVLLVGGCVAVAIILRTINVQHVCLSRDEAFSWRLTQYDIIGLLRRCALDTHPPGHFAVLKCWTACFGDSAEMLRLPSVFVGVLLVPVGYVLAFQAGAAGPARQLSAAIAAMLIAVAPVEVMAARTARMYSLAALLTGLSTLQLIVCLRARRPHWMAWALYATIATALCYTHYFGLFSVIAQMSWLGGCLLKQWRMTPTNAQLVLRYSLTALLGILAAYSVWLPVLLCQWSAVHSGFWPVMPSIVQLLSRFASWASGIEEPSVIGSMSILAFVIVAAAGTRRITDIKTCLLVQAAVPWAFAVFLSLVAQRPILVERYFTLAHLPWCVYCGIFAASFHDFRARVIIALALIAAAAHGTRSEFLRWNGGPCALEVALSRVSSSKTEAEAIIVEDASELNRVRYYATRASRSAATTRVRIIAQVRAGLDSHLASINVSDTLPSPPEDLALGTFWCIAVSPMTLNTDQLESVEVFKDGSRMIVTLAHYRQPVP